MERKIPINLESLFDLSARLNETYDIHFILNAVLLSLMGKLRALRGSVYILDDGKVELSLLISKGSVSAQIIPNLNPAECNSSPLIMLEGKSHCERTLLNLGFECVAPVLFRGKILALICLGKRISTEEISSEEILYARLVTTIAAISLQNARNYSSLENAKNNIEKQNLLLKTLFEISSDFSSLLSKKEIIRMLSYRLMGHLMLTKYALLLTNEQGKAETIINKFDSEIKPELAEVLKNITTAKQISELQSTESYTILKASGIVIVSPMYVQGQIKGVLLAGKKLNKEDYTEADIQFLSALGNSAISSLENERLFHQELEKKRLETEMATALVIQRKLLPKENPKYFGWDINGISIPSRQIGGDYYDFIKVDENRLLVAIADVSGKGLPASLLMANVQAALRVLAPFSSDLSQLIATLNRIIYENTDSDKFVTFFCGYIDTHYNTFTYINAGHNPPYHIDANGNILELKEGGLILGFIDEDLPYQTGCISIASGDMIFLFTDGLNEARNDVGEEFTDQSIINLLLDNRKEKACVISEILLAEVNSFAGDMPQYDDLSFVVIKKE